jgi:hypothetical protein
MTMSHNIAMPRKKSDRIVLEDWFFGQGRHNLQRWNQAERILGVAEPHVSFGAKGKDPK